MSNSPLSKAAGNETVNYRGGEYYIGFLIDPKGTKIRPVTDRATLNFAVTETLEDAKSQDWDWQILLCRDIKDHSHASPVQLLLMNETRDSVLDALQKGGIAVVASWDSANGSLPTDSQ